MHADEDLWKKSFEDVLGALLFHHELPLHSVVTHAAEVGTFEGKSPSFVRGELYGGGLAFFESLLDVKGLQLESVIVIGGSNDEFDVFTFLHSNGIRRKLVLLGRYLDLAYVRRRLSSG